MMTLEELNNELAFTLEMLKEGIDVERNQHKQNALEAEIKGMKGEGNIEELTKEFNKNVRWNKESRKSGDIEGTVLFARVAGVLQAQIRGLKNA